MKGAFVDQLKVKNLNDIIEEASYLAAELYKLMDNGMTIDFKFKGKEKPTHLVVTKPSSHLDVSIPSVEFEHENNPSDWFRVVDLRGKTRKETRKALERIRKK